MSFRQVLSPNTARRGGLSCSFLTFLLQGLSEEPKRWHDGPCFDKLLGFSLSPQISQVTIGEMQQLQWRPVTYQCPSTPEVVCAQSLSWGSLNAARTSKDHPQLLRGPSPGAGDAGWWRWHKWVNSFLAVMKSDSFYPWNLLCSFFAF